MIRNDADIVLPFLAQCLELFDGTAIIDVQSTDGTSERLARCAAAHERIEVFTTTRRERFQGAMMNLLSRRAFAQGADWVFLLDADEFLDVDSRAELESTLAGFNAPVMQLSWINLVPTEYGSFAEFDPSQEFHHAGRPAIYSKVALSHLFAANHPGYHIHEGNHYVAPALGAPPVTPSPGLNLLHVPVRSAHRLKYKVAAARRMTQAKHNRFERECEHLDALDELLQDNTPPAALNHVAAHYGEAIRHIEPLEPPALGWPRRRLPPGIAERLATLDAPRAADQAQTLLGEAERQWDQARFVPGTPVAAILDGATVRILPQPIAGSGAIRDPRFEPLGDAPADPRSSLAILADATAASCLPIRHDALSRWTRLVPLMFALVAAHRPRRFVELGVHNGMSFFAACQAAEHCRLDTECVAIDTWIGDPQAGFHDDSVLAGVKGHLAQHYRSQIYLQAYFDTALGCFADGSIDLLHIDGLHTYQAVAQDFRAWLPKLSDRGVILFHDVNVHDRNFGVWLLWQELSRIYPAFALLHEHGLGILYVGAKPSPLADLLRKLATEPEWAVLAQTHFEALGTLSASRPPAEGDALRAEIARAREEARLAQQRLDHIQASTLWRGTFALRWMLERMPLVRRAGRLLRF